MSRLDKVYKKVKAIEKGQKLHLFIAFLQKEEGWYRLDYDLSNEKFSRTERKSESFDTEDKALERFDELKNVRDKNFNSAKCLIMYV